MPNKAQFIELLAERLDGDKKKAQIALDAVLDTVYANVAKGERVVLTGFGVFEKRVRAARTARNPATGATVKVKKTAVPAFRPGAEFKDYVSGAKKLPRIVTERVSAATKSTASTARAAAKAATKTTAKKTAAKKTTAKKTTAKKTAAKKAPAKKTTAKKTAAKKAPAKKTTAKKTAAKKAR